MELTANFRHRNVVCLLRGQTQELSKPKQFIYVLHLVPRLHSDSNWTKEDNTVLERHLSRFKEAIKLGHLILARRTQEPGDRTFGIAILEAADEAAARAFKIFAKRQTSWKESRYWCGTDEVRFAEVAVGITAAEPRCMLR
jgi:hypothetical protein